MDQHPLVRRVVSLSITNLHFSVSITITLFIIGSNLLNILEVNGVRETELNISLYNFHCVILLTLYFFLKMLIFDPPPALVKLIPVF